MSEGRFRVWVCGGRKAHGGSALSSSRDADQFAERCGFPRHNERQLGRMLLFRDVYKD
jgi:hypothetical protein